VRDVQWRREANGAAEGNETASAWAKGAEGKMEGESSESRKSCGRTRQVERRMAKGIKGNVHGHASFDQLAHDAEMAETGGRVKCSQPSVLAVYSHVGLLGQKVVHHGFVTWRLYARAG